MVLCHVKRWINSRSVREYAAGKAGGVPRRICFDAHVKTAAASGAAALARFKCLWSNPMGSLRHTDNKKETIRMDGFFFGDPYGNRTHVTAVKGRCLNRLTNGPGSGNLTRTDDTPGMNRMLYQLSYAAI